MTYKKKKMESRVNTQVDFNSENRCLNFLSLDIYDFTIVRDN